MNARLEEDVSVSDLSSYLLTALHPHGNSTAAGRAVQHAANIRSVDDGDVGEQDEPTGGGRERQRRGGRR